jgi:hypothetical protein
MSDLSLVFSESIDDVLKLVQETPRGRWFLDAYASRLKSDGTSTILTAIAKLESNLSHLSNSGASAELLDKARSAIATARKEIANLEPQAAKLSTEAQLFSNLAELSRKAFSNTEATPSVGKGVERALRLVADLDRDLNGTSATPEQSKPAVRFFKQDEEIFEPAPAPKAVTKPVELPEIANKGAKLTIRRLNADQPMEAPIIETVAEQPAAPAIEEAPSRIVIIRRKAEDTIAVPLVDTIESATVSAA